MTQIENGWGAGPSPHYEALAAPFRPLFRKIAAEAVSREVDRRLPAAEIDWLKQAGFGAVRLPKESGGAGASLPELFALLIELSEADSNLTQALRAHFGFTEDILSSRNEAHRHAWSARIASGDIVGNAWSEVGDARQQAFSTRVEKNGHGWTLNGAKFYTTGSLFAEWIDVGASAEDDVSVGVIVARSSPGVAVVDDWDGFGQIGTASGTATFTDVAVAADQIVADNDRFRYGQAFFQLVHLATLAGIGRAAATDLAARVAARTRQYTNGAGPRSSQDPQVLQVVGRVRAAAYASGAIVLKAAEALQRAFEARLTGDEDAERLATNIADLETAEAQTVVTDLILEATTLVFDALGASATRKDAALDRYWRNARTLSSHNPRIYKHRIIGDFAVNGTPHPDQWRIGRVA